MNNNGIRRRIIEELYNSNEEKPGLMTPHGRLIDEIGIENNELDRNINYLHEKRFIDLLRAGKYYAAKITPKGIDLIENPEEFNTLFPQVNITQNIVQDSSHVVIGSNNSININESFNEIYQDPEFRNSNNKEQIKDIIQELQIELGNETVNKSKIQKCYDWLKINANWSIPMVSQIIIAVMTGSL
jgi:hypothetical protein